MAGLGSAPALARDDRQAERDPARIDEVFGCRDPQPASTIGVIRREPSCSHAACPGSLAFDIPDLLGTGRSQEALRALAKENNLPDRSFFKQNDALPAGGSRATPWRGAEPALR
jgi:hypothetical protein